MVPNPEEITVPGWEGEQACKPLQGSESPAARRPPGAKGLKRKKEGLSRWRT